MTHESIPWHHISKVPRRLKHIRPVLGILRTVYPGTVINGHTPYVRHQTGLTLSTISQQPQVTNVIILQQGKLRHRGKPRKGTIPLSSFSHSQYSVMLGKADSILHAYREAIH